MHVIFSLMTSIAQDLPQFHPKALKKTSPPALHYHFGGLSLPYRNIPTALLRRTRRTFPTKCILFIRTALSSPTSIAPHLVRRLPPHVCHFTDATMHSTGSASPTL